jgi:hypothetical protein
LITSVYMLPASFQKNQKYSVPPRPRAWRYDPRGGFHYFPHSYFNTGNGSNLYDFHRHYGR